jgi:hypothetical protein
MKPLKEIKKLYPIGSQFFSATKNLKSPLKVSSLRVAEHLDRQEEIRQLKENKSNRKRLEYLLSLEPDIINSDGGVIYCGETKTWAEKIEQ